MFFIFKSDFMSTSCFKLIVEIIEKLFIIIIECSRNWLYVFFYLFNGIFSPCSSNIVAIGVQLCKLSIQPLAACISMSSLQTLRSTFQLHSAPRLDLFLFKKVQLFYRLRDCKVIQSVYAGTSRWFIVLLKRLWKSSLSLRLNKYAFADHNRHKFSF